MDPGGCLHTSDENEEEEEEFVPRALEGEFSDSDSDSEPETKKEEPAKEPLFEAPIPLGECPICYEDLKMIDFTITKCGHTFHSSCLFKAMEQNLDCPMCRCQLLVVQEDEEEDEDEDEDEEDEEEEEEEEEEEPKVTIEQLAEKLQHMGYTPLDFLTLFMGDILKRQDAARQTDDFITELTEKIDDIMDGKITLSHRDQRSYAEVVRPVAAGAGAGAGAGAEKLVRSVHFEEPVIIEQK
jgi:hypothetical protein